MTTPSINLHELPKLTHEPSSYAPWKKEVEIALQYVHCWNTVLGSDPEPAREQYVIDRTSNTFTSDRNIRAGSAQPSQDESIGRRGLSEEDKERWEQWATREHRAQAILKGTVSISIRLDLEDMLSAADMWNFCLSWHRMSFMENQREVSRKLYLLNLRDDATSEEMADHVEVFAQLVMEGRLAGLTSVSTAEGRVNEFLLTILKQSYTPIREYIANLPIPQRTWQAVLMKYNAESARRKAMDGPVRGQGGREGVVMTSESTRVTREAVIMGRPRTSNMSKVRCYNCQNLGHYARDCQQGSKVGVGGGDDGKGRNGNGRGKGDGKGRTRGSRKPTDRQP